MNTTGKEKLKANIFLLFVGFLLFQIEPAYTFEEASTILPDVLEGVSLKGKRVLDVGTSAGDAAAWMIKAGMDVYATETDSEALKKAREKVPQNKLLNTRFSNIAEKYYGYFDLVTAFLYSGHGRETETFAQRLSQTLRTDGIAVVGFYQESDYLKAKISLERYFEETLTFERHALWDRYIMVCKKPKSAPSL